MEYTRDEYCGMLLSLSTYNGELVLVHENTLYLILCQHHPDANVFRRLWQCLRGTGSATSTAHMMQVAHGMYGRQLTKIP
jgi:hypothetical protein